MTSSFVHESLGSAEHGWRSILQEGSRERAGLLDPIDQLPIDDGDRHAWNSAEAELIPVAVRVTEVPDGPVQARADGPFPLAGDELPLIRREAVERMHARRAHDLPTDEGVLH